MTGPATANPPLFTYVVPCRNEAAFIDSAIDSLLAQAYPPDRIEIVVVDGMSDDGTRERLDALRALHPNLRVVDNPFRTSPKARNIGIEHSTGEIICLINAHCVLDPDFTRLSVEALERTGADTVGGSLRTRNLGDSVMANAIPLAADSPFGNGGNRYRSNPRAGFVDDTLPYCAYPRKSFATFGTFDEDMIRDQDEEINYRLLNRGGKIYYDPAIRSVLFIRPTLAKLFRQHYQYGLYKPLVALKVGFRHTLVQTVPALFVTTLGLLSLLALGSRTARRLLALVVALYGSAALLASLRIATAEAGLPAACASPAGRLQTFCALPPCFACLHVGYGLGFALGFVEIFILKKNRERAHVDEPLTR